MGEKTGSFLCHRIRERVRHEIDLAPLGGEGKMAEVDETYIGMNAGKEKRKGLRPQAHRLLSLAERNEQVRSFHGDNARPATILPIMKSNIDTETTLMTDEASQYRSVGDRFARREFTSHGAGEYVRGAVHSNNIKGYFSIFKRGMKCIYQHCGEQHAHRYLAGFDFRYSRREKLVFSEANRMEKSISGIVGKCLTCRRIGEAA